jgi:hypothetical protein
MNSPQLSLLVAEEKEESARVSVEWALAEGV